MQSGIGLAALEAQVRRDIALTAHPRADWMKERKRHGKTVLDVLIVGAGQSGLATAFQLIRERVRNILVIDRAPEGQEGVWVTYARMPTLRSPKDQTGPDLDVPSLTFQAWFEAQHGAQAWDDLGLIASADWHAYLVWYRRVLDLPVRNNAGATSIEPGELDDGGRCLLVTLSTGEVLATRKLVLATGQDGTGEWWMPDFIRALPADKRACTCDDIDFASLRGRSVAVLGAGSSAMDNAADRARGGRRRRPVLPPRAAVSRATIPLAHLRGLHAPYRRDARHLALADHGTHHARARRLSHRHLQARAGLPRLPHASRPHMDRRAHWKTAASGSRPRAVPSMPTLRSAASAHDRTSGLGPNSPGSPTRSRYGAIASLRRPERRIRCWQPSPISARTIRSRSVFPALPHGSPISTSSASARRSVLAPPAAASTP